MVHHGDLPVLAVDRRCKLRLVGILLVYIQTVVRKLPTIRKSKTN